MSVEENIKRKNLDLEFMRIIACFFVIFNHTGDNGFSMFSQRPLGSLLFWIDLFISVFCKFSVPMFLAISGAILLNKEESISKIWKHRIFRILFVLIVCSFGYYLVEVMVGRQKFNFIEFIKQLYSSNWNGSYWYLYAYIPFLIGLPFLRAMVKFLTEREYYYMIAINIFFSGILPIIEYLLFEGKITLNGNAKMGWICSSIVIYPCLGYFLQYEFEIEKYHKMIPVFWVVNFVTILISCYMTYRKVIITGECSQDASQAFHNTFVLINCITIFITVKYIFRNIKISVFAKKWIESIGGCTFGIYLIHVLLLQITKIQKLWPFFKDILHMNHMIAAFCVCFCIMMLGYVLTLIGKKLPVIRKII